MNPLCVAAGTAGTGAALKNDDQLNLEGKCVDEKCVDKEILRNGDAACNTDNIDIDVDDHAYHNAGTMRYRKKTGSNNTDLDSIEHLDEDEIDDKKHDGLEDDIDSVSFASNSLLLCLQLVTFFLGLNAAHEKRKRGTTAKTSKQKEVEES